MQITNRFQIFRRDDSFSIFFIYLQPYDASTRIIFRSRLKCAWGPSHFYIEIVCVSPNAKQLAKPPSLPPHPLELGSKHHPESYFCWCIDGQGTQETTLDARVYGDYIVLDFPNVDIRRGPKAHRSRVLFIAMIIKNCNNRNDVIQAGFEV